MATSPEMAADLWIFLRVAGSHAPRFVSSKRGRSALYFAVLLDDVDYGGLS